MEELVVPTLVSGSRLRTKKLLKAGIAQLVVRQLADPRLRTKKLLKAGIAQLVEHQLPKLRVAGSNPVSRS